MMEKQLIKWINYSSKTLTIKIQIGQSYKKYFMHGILILHWLDVHDCSSCDLPTLKQECDFTIEPGIYIREEILGIRLENDYLMTWKMDKT